MAYLVELDKSFFNREINIMDNFKKVKCQEKVNISIKMVTDLKVYFIKVLKVVKEHIIITINPMNVVIMRKAKSKDNLNILIIQARNNQDYINIITELKMNDNIIKWIHPR